MIKPENIAKISEDSHQCAIFVWIQQNLDKDPRLALLFAVPNGGKRDKRTAQLLKQTGVKSGVPDLFLPVAAHRCHGLFIELKIGSNKLSANQTLWAKQLTEQGYAHRVCYGWESAVETICEYLRISLD